MNVDIETRSCQYTKILFLIALTIVFEMSTLAPPNAPIPNHILAQDWSQLMPRYLVPIEPKRCGHFFTDVLIIGGGLAGLRAAHEVDPSLLTMI